MLFSPPLPQRRFFERAVKVAVQVDCCNLSNTERKIGTGIVLTRDGHIATALHVVRRRPIIFVNRLRLDDDEWIVHRWGKYAADVVYADARTDIAILKLRKPPKTLAIAKLGRSDRLKIGDPVFRVGCDDSYQLASGYIYDVKSRSSTRAPHYYVSMLAEQGMSGGPAFNAAGEVVGSTLELNGSNADPSWMSFLPIDEMRRRIFYRKAVIAVFPESDKL
jgi:S1-C subfamily serine protease